uniref:Uncharacterized protein n=1 Tax=Anguilla anguilla TaxID=7936 RepID=A0A0E9PN75_ANGAN
MTHSFTFSVHTTQTHRLSTADSYLQRGPRISKNGRKNLS